MDYMKFDQYCKRLIECYKKMDDNAFYKAEPCANEENIKAVEDSIGVKLPEQLKNFFLNFSKKVEISVFLSDEFCDSLPKEFQGVFGARYEISLNEVKSNEENRRDWIEECFVNEDDEYDRVWYKKLGIIDVGNGDIIALDIDVDPYNPPVVYLSHDDGDGHGAILGKDFDSFLVNLIMVGGCGMEDWQILPFISDLKEGINTDCENAKVFRRLIGFELFE